MSFRSSSSVSHHHALVPYDSYRNPHLALVTCAAVVMPNSLCRRLYGDVHGGERQAEGVDDAHDARVDGVPAPLGGVALQAQVRHEVRRALDRPALEHPEDLEGDARVAQEQEHERRTEDLGLLEVHEGLTEGQDLDRLLRPALQLRVTLGFLVRGTTGGTARHARSWPGL